MPYKDPEKQKAAQRASYEKTKTARMTKQAKDRKEFRAWMLTLKAGKPCTDCLETFHPAAMHWHHRPGEHKIGSVANLALKLNRQLILDEIAKCDLICANCHAVHTFGADYGICQQSINGDAHAS